MANNTIKRVWNANKLVSIEDLSGMTFQGENGGHTFEVSGVDDSGSAVSISGTVTAVFLRADNAAISISGSVSSGKAVATLTQNCYTVPGRFLFTIFVTANDQKTAIYSATGNVARTEGTATGSVPPLVTDSIQTGSMTASGDVTVNGVLDVTQRRCETTLSSAGWYRVCKITTIGRGDYSFAIDLNICRQFYYANNEQHSIRLVGISDSFSFVNEDSKSNTQIIKRIRYTRDSNNNGYVDIYYDFSNANIVYCEFAAHGFYPELYTIESLQSVDPSPNGETVLTTYEFTANGIRTVTLTSAHSSVTINGQKVARSGQVVSLWVDFTVSAAISGYDYLINTPTFASNANALVYGAGNTVQTNVRLYADEGNSGLRCYGSFPAGRYIAFITYITTDA